MQKLTLRGLAIVHVCLLLALTGSFAQRLEAEGGKATNSTRIVAVEPLGACSLDNQATTVGSEQLLSATGSASCVPRSECCKICSKGKACGDTCIRRDYTCHKGRGCACNQEEVCPN